MTAEPSNQTGMTTDADDNRLQRCTQRVLAVDLGSMVYSEAFDLQRAWHDRVLALREDASANCVGALLLVEHDPPVITISRRPGVSDHLIASPEQLDAAGVTVEQTDRGGDITYHGPGQLVVYPILDLQRLGQNLHAYMRMLEDIVIRVIGAWGIDGSRDDSATGVWVDGAKLCAMGVRVRRWVTMHGLALNVDPAMEHFDLIVPCGLAGRSVTSLCQIQGEACPSMDQVKRAMIEAFEQALGSRLK